MAEQGFLDVVYKNQWVDIGFRNNANLAAYFTSRNQRGGAIGNIKRYATLEFISNADRTALFRACITLLVVERAPRVRS
jgi:hypothetical protein